MKKYKVFCERCNEEINDNIEDHLHGYEFARTYMPNVYLKNLVRKQKDPIG